MSIEDVLCHNIIQHIISFNLPWTQKAVNSKWNNLANQSEDNYNRMRLEELHDPSHAGSTWIVHPTRTHLNALEMAFGYRGPVNVIDQNALEDCADGDRLLIYDGVYDRLCYSISAQFIGIGPGVYFRNSTLSDGQINPWMSPQRRSIAMNVLIKNCKFQNYSMGFEFGLRKVNLSLIDCSFENIGCVLDKEGRGDTKIQNCLFRKCGTVVDWEAYDHHAILIHDAGKGSNLECVGNTFVDSVTHPIFEHQGQPFASDAPQYEIVMGGTYSLENNVLIGNNQFKNQQFDANSIYGIVVPMKLVPDCDAFDHSLYKQLMRGNG